MLKEFLREHRHGLYMELLLSGKSVMHLNEVDNKARHQMACTPSIRSPMFPLSSSASFLSVWFLPVIWIS